MASIKSVNQGVMVRIDPSNSRKIVEVIKKTRRSFSAEVNLAVEKYSKIAKNDWK